MSGKEKRAFEPRESPREEYCSPARRIDVRVAMLAFHSIGLEL